MSERRIGKSSTLKKMRAEPKGSWHPIYQDVSKDNSTLEFAKSVYNECLPLERCREVGDRLLVLLQKHDILSAFSASLPILLKSIMQEKLDITLLERWTKLWTDLGEPYPECKIGLRLLNAGTHYLLSSPRDESVFITLRTEERTLIKDLLGLLE